MSGTCDKGEPYIIAMLPHVVVGHAGVCVHRFRKNIYLVIGNTGSTKGAEKPQIVGPKITTNSSDNTILFQVFHPTDDLLLCEVQILADFLVRSGVNGKVGLYPIDYFSVSGIHAGGGAPFTCQEMIIKKALHGNAEPLWMIKK